MPLLTGKLIFEPFPSSPLIRLTPLPSLRSWQTYINMYFFSGALAVQNLVDSFIISQDAGAPVKLETNVIDFPSPAYEEAGFWGSVASFYGIFMVRARRPLEGPGFRSLHEQSLA
jgi:hypothetical protein